MAWIMVAGAGVSLAGKAFGAVKEAKANKANQKLLTKQQEENSAAYNNGANKDFLQTNVAKDATKQLKEGLESSQKAVAGRAAITGGSDEAKVAGNTAANKTFVDGLSRLSSNATQYQNQREAIYRTDKNRLDNMQMGINSAKAESAANLGEAAGQLGGAMMGQGMLKDSPVASSTVGDPGTVGRTGNFAPMKSKGGLLDPVLDNKLK